MSAKGRAATGYKPDKNGFYATNPGTTRAVLPYLGIEPGMRILEPQCGKGAIAKVLREKFGGTIEIVGIEIDKKRAAFASRAVYQQIVPASAADGDTIELPVFDAVLHADQFEPRILSGYAKFDQCITNPFFAVWQLCAETCFEWAPKTTLLLPLGAKASKKRGPWWDTRPAHERVLRSRPSFAQSVKCEHYNAQAKADRCTYQVIIEVDVKAKKVCPVCAKAGLRESRTTITRSDSTDYAWYTWAPEITRGLWDGINTPEEGPDGQD